MAIPWESELIYLPRSLAATFLRSCVGRTEKRRHAVQAPSTVTVPAEQEATPTQSRQPRAVLSNVRKEAVPGGTRPHFHRPPGRWLPGRVVTQRTDTLVSSCARPARRPPATHFTSRCYQMLRFLPKMRKQIQGTPPLTATERSGWHDVTKSWTQEATESQCSLQVPLAHGRPRHVPWQLLQPQSGPARGFWCRPATPIPGVSTVHRGHTGLLLPAATATLPDTLSRRRLSLEETPQVTLIPAMTAPCPPPYLHHGDGTIPTAEPCRKGHRGTAHVQG